MNDENNIFGDVIYAYTRQDALNDGVFKDVSKMAKEASIVYPTAVTSNLFHKYISPTPMPSGQDEKGRLWDVLWTFKNSVKKSKSNRLTFKVLFSGKLVELNAVCEATSPTDPSPAITIMLPEDN
jgi:hypothetical protein